MYIVHAGPIKITLRQKQPQKPTILQAVIVTLLGSRDHRVKPRL